MGLAKQAAGGPAKGGRPGGEPTGIRDDLQAADRRPVARGVRQALPDRLARQVGRCHPVRGQPPQRGPLPGVGARRRPMLDGFLETFGPEHICFLVETCLDLHEHTHFFPRSHRGNERLVEAVVLPAL